MMNVPKYQRLRFWKRPLNSNKSCNNFGDGVNQNLWAL
jgi:hypothetical protein